GAGEGWEGEGAGQRRSRWVREALRMVKKSTSSGQQSWISHLGPSAALPMAARIQNTHKMISSQNISGPPRGRNRASRNAAAPGSRMNMKVAARTAVE